MCAIHLWVHLYASVCWCRLDADITLKGPLISCLFQHCFAFLRQALVLPVEHTQFDTGIRTHPYTHPGTHTWTHAHPGANTLKPCGIFYSCTQWHTTTDFTIPLYSKLYSGYKSLCDMSTAHTCTHTHTQNVRTHTYTNTHNCTSHLWLQLQF